MINELFIKSPNKLTYKLNKQDITDNSLVFIEEEESLIALGHEYLFIPSDGEKGQVLTKTEDGVKWKDVSSSGEVDLSDYYTKEEANKIYQEKLPQGEAGLVLTTTENGIEWKKVLSSGGGLADLSDYYTKTESNNKFQQKVRYFDTLEEYESANVAESDVILVEETRKIYYNNKVYGKHTWKVFDEYVSPYLDVVLVNNSTLQKVATQDLEQYDVNEWTPIGIVIIPKEHDVYGTGEAGVMSLTYMDYNNPDLGWQGTLNDITDSSSAHMYTARSNSAISGMPDKTNFVRCPNYGTMDNLPSSKLMSELTSNSSNNTIPSDIWTGVQCPKDLNAKYYPYDVNTRYYAPSPYLSDGSRNPDYYISSGNYSDNALARFDGKSYTLLILNIATAQGNWKTDATIVNILNTNYAPAACCTWRFYTIGTSQGDWYLPSCGELGYLGARFKKFDNTVELINNRFGNKALGILYNDNIVGSQVVPNGSVCRLSTLNGSIGMISTGLGISRAMTRITI